MNVSVLTLLLASSMVAGQAGDTGDHEYRSGLRVDGSFGEEWQSAEAQGWFRDLDLTELVVLSDSESTIEIRIGVVDALRSAAPATEPPMDFAALNVFFSFNNQTYLVQWMRDSGFGIPQAILYSVFGAVPEERSAIFSRNASDIIEVAWSESADPPGIVLELPREKVVGLRGEPLIPGSQLAGLYAASVGRSQYLHAAGASLPGCMGVALAVSYCVAEVRDRFPNNGYLPAYTILSAPKHEGHLIYYSPEPQRGSNGEATTYIMEIHVVNLAPEPDHLSIETTGIPDGWAVEVTDAIHVPSGATAVIPVIVSVPFFHIHGESRGFDVKATSRLAAEVSFTQPLSVHWFDVAQPSGHHPGVYLHAGSDGAGWWNVLSEQGGADGQWITVQDYVDGALSGSAGGARYEGQLKIPHLPAFSLGLDARMAEVAEFRGTWQAAFAGSGTIDVSIIHEAQAGELVVGRTTLFEGSVPVSFAVGSNPLELALRPTPDADFFALRPGNLWMQFDFNLELSPDAFVLYTATNPALAAPPVQVGAGSHVELPLNDYHDVLTSRVGDGGVMVNLEASSILMHPGNTQVIVGQATAAGPVRVQLAGPGAEWATATPTTVESGKPFHIVIKVPKTTEPGESRGLVVKLVDAVNPVNQAATILRIDVTSELQPDETEQAAALLPGQRSSPSLTLGVLVASLGLAFVIRRR